MRGSTKAERGSMAPSSGEVATPQQKGSRGPSSGEVATGLGEGWEP